ncbi:COMM domain-containing protein 4 [Sarcoptes scabiei]|nr:COMM domain-containing protein 4 [Sarcoptes scabiei]
MKTSIIQLDSSPSQNRKYLNERNSLHSYHHSIDLNDGRSVPNPRRNFQSSRARPLPIVDSKAVSNSLDSPDWSTSSPLVALKRSDHKKTALTSERFDLEANNSNSPIFESKYPPRPSSSSISSTQKSHPMMVHSEHYHHHQHSDQISDDSNRLFDLVNERNFQIANPIPTNHYRLDQSLHSISPINEVNVNDISASICPSDSIGPGDTSSCMMAQNVSNSFRSSSKSCDRYGFFLEDNDEDYETPSVQDLKYIRIKETKWLQMLNNWGYYINFKWDKIRDRCRKGIPHSLRSQAWFHLCGAHLQKNRFPTLYSELIARNIPEEIKNDISKDLHRQFPNHEMFADQNGLGQADLYNVLKAFAIYKPKMGYCQAQAPIAAVFLMHMPAERAFWCLVALSKYYITGYFMRNLEDIQIHGQMLFSFVKKYCSSAYNLLNRQKIEPVLYMTEWFMCIFSRNLPWPSVLRVWDMFLCEGN